MGPVAVPALEKTLEDSNLLLRLRAAEGLVRLAPEHGNAVKALMAAFSGVGNAALAERARRSVVSIGAPLVPQVAKLLDDAYIPVQVLAIETLGNIGVPAQTVVPALTVRLDSERTAVRVAVLKALARIGPKDVVLPSIQALVADSDPAVASVAQEMVSYFPAEVAPAAAPGPAPAK
jgi:HEAT repeat protein